MAGAIQIRAEGQGYVVASISSASVLAAINCDLGFIPVSARGINVTDGDAEWYWFRGMDSGMCVSMTTAIVSVTSNGITVLDGSAGNGIGLTIGTNCQEASKNFLVCFER